MSNYLKLISIFLALSLGLLALDSFFPKEEVCTNVIHVDKSRGLLFYSIPLSGGDVSTCSIRENELQAFPPRSEITVKKTAIFGRCASVNTISTEDLKCRNDRRATQYREAIALEQQRNLAEAYSMYSGICRAYHPPSHEEDPCEASFRLYDRMQEANRLVIAALSDHKSRTGKYPDSLSVVLSEFPQPIRETAEGFTYCKKEHPSERTSQCSDGGTALFDNEISVQGANLYKTNYDLEEETISSCHQSCTKSRAMIESGV